jgi:hypothetical protein
MLLIEEYVRLILEEEQESQEEEQESQEEEQEVENNEKKYTFKELYDFLRFVKHGKNAKKALGFVTAVSGGAVLDSAGNLSSIAEETASKLLDNFLIKYDLPRGNPIKVLAKFYGVNDAKGLSGISIPNNISNLIDDKVESAFITSLVKDLKIKSKQNPDETVDETFVLEKLKEFTSSTYEKTSGSYVENK